MSEPAVETVLKRTNYIRRRIKDLIELGRKTFYVKEYQAGIDEAEILGVIVAKYCEWTPQRILKVVSSALEDANMHTLNAQIGDLLSENSVMVRRRKEEPRYFVQGQGWIYDFQVLGAIDEMLDQRLSKTTPPIG